MDFGYSIPLNNAINEFLVKFLLEKLNARRNRIIYDEAIKNKYINYIYFHK